MYTQLLLFLIMFLFYCRLDNLEDRKRIEREINQTGWKDYLKVQQRGVTENKPKGNISKETNCSFASLSNNRKNVDTSQRPNKPVVPKGKTKSLLKQLSVRHWKEKTRRVELFERLNPMFRLLRLFRNETSELWGSSVRICPERSGIQYSSSVAGFFVKYAVIDKIDQWLSVPYFWFSDAELWAVGRCRTVAKEVSYISSSLFGGGAFCWHIGLVCHCIRIIIISSRDYGVYHSDRRHCYLSVVFTIGVNWRCGVSPDREKFLARRLIVSSGESYRYYSLIIVSESRYGLSIYKIGVTLIISFVFTWLKPGVGSFLYTSSSTVISRDTCCFVYHSLVHLSAGVLHSSWEDNTNNGTGTVTLVSNE